MIFLQLFREVRIMKFLDHPNIGKDVWFHLFWVCYFLISLPVLFLPVNNKFLLLSLPHSEVVWGYRNRQNPVPCNGVCKWRYGWCCLNNSVNRKIMTVACCCRNCLWQHLCMYSWFSSQGMQTCFRPKKLLPSWSCIGCFQWRDTFPGIFPSSLYHL